MFKETCGEIFGQVRFAGAVAGRGCGSRAGKILPAHPGLVILLVDISVGRPS